VPQNKYTTAVVCGEVVVQRGGAGAKAGNAVEADVVVALKGAVARGIYQQFVLF
jgi:hypothetical protein